MYKSINYIYILIIVLLFSGTIVFGQDYSTSDSLFLEKINNHTVFRYNVKQGNTIFGISKEFNIPMEDIYRLNPDLNKNPIKAEMEIYIPISNKDIICKKTWNNKNTTKLFYNVGKKETLFKIAKIYFDCEVNDIMKLNQLKNSNLQEGQILHIGYLLRENGRGDIVSEMNKTVIKNVQPENSTIVKKEYVKFDKIISKPEKIVSKIKELKESEKKRKLSDDTEEMKFQGIVSNPQSSTEEAEENIKRMHRDSGIALWNKESRIKGIYVLSNDAALNTMIEIINPMLQRKIFAKVIGNIPTNTYPDNIKVVLSPDAAISLGALDSKFYVKLNYLK